MNAKLLILIGAVVIGVVAYFLFSGSMSEEDKIRAAISHTADAAGNKHLGDFLEHVSDKFSGPQQTGKPELTNFMRMIFLQNKEINVTVREMLIELDEGAATAKATVVATVSAKAKGEKSTSGPVHGFSKETNRFEVFFEKEEDQWMIVKAGHSDLEFK